MPTRKEVYEAIDSEREYQDMRWGDEFNDEEWSVGDWLIFIESYVEDGKSKIGYDESLDSVRKIAALAVACMEYRGVRERR